MATGAATGGAVGVPIRAFGANDTNLKVNDPLTWALALLKRIGITPTDSNVKALIGWSNAEGGHWHNGAKFNPLNTTQPMPGAGNTGSQGNIKVYTSWNQGIDATAKTLTNGHYSGILRALAHGSPEDVANAIDASPWGTHGPLIHKAIKDANPHDTWVKSLNPNDPVGDPLKGAINAVNSIPNPFELAKEIWAKLSSGDFWLSVGKILIGIIALIMGVVFFAKDFAKGLPKV